MAAIRGVPSTEMLNHAMLASQQLDLRARRVLVRDAYKAVGRKHLPTIDAFFIGSADEETLESMSAQGTIVVVAVEALRAEGVPVIATVGSVKECLELGKHLFNRFFGDMVNGPKIDGDTVAKKFTVLIG